MSELPTLFILKIIRPTGQKFCHREKKIGLFGKVTFIKIKPTVFNRIRLKICEKSSFSTQLCGKGKAKQPFQDSAPFRPFLGKTGPNSALAAHFFTRSLLSCAAELSACWQHWTRLCTVPGHIFVPLLLPNWSFSALGSNNSKRFKYADP